MKDIAPFISGAVGGLFTLLAAWFITGYLSRNIKSHEFLFQFTNRYQDILATKHKLKRSKDFKNATKDAGELYRRLFSLIFDEFYAYQQGFLDPDIFMQWMKWRRVDYNGDKVAGLTYKEAWQTFITTGPVADHNFPDFLNKIHACKSPEDVARLVKKYAPGFLRRTIFLSQLIGLFALFIAVSILVHKDSMIAIKNAILQDAAFFRAAGALLMLVGLAIVLGHNIWKRGLLALVVTVLGWILLASGMIAFWTPHNWAMWLVEKSRYSEWFYWYAGAVLAVGAYLTIAGFLTSPGFPKKKAILKRTAKSPASYSPSGPV